MCWRPTPAPMTRATPKSVWMRSQSNFSGTPALPCRWSRQELSGETTNTSGVVNVFLFCEPLRGRRWVDVTERRTKVDWAHQIKELVDERHPQAERIVLVMDNLNTHTPASLYEAFDPEEARRLAEKLEIHYTPKHGSWLNMAEIELSVLSRQCLDRRVPNFESLQTEACAWQERRDAAGHRSTGVSPQKMPASSSSDCILRFRSNRALGGVARCF